MKQDNYEVLLDQALAKIKAAVLKVKQTYPENFNSVHEGYAVIQEATDELLSVKAKNFDKSKGEKKAIQAGAMLFRFIVELTDNSAGKVESKSPFEIKSFEEVCAQMGKDPKNYEIESTEEPESIFLNQIDRLMLIFKFYRQGTEMEPNNTNQKKWWQIFDLQVSSSNPSGFRFLGSAYPGTYARSVLGPLLWLQDKETADYVGRTYENEFRKAILLNK